MQSVPFGHFQIEVKNYLQNYACFDEQAFLLIVWQRKNGLGKKRRWDGSTSTSDDFESFQNESKRPTRQLGLPNQQKNLKVMLDKKREQAKKVDPEKVFIENDIEIAVFWGNCMRKNKCGVGGSAKDGRNLNSKEITEKQKWSKSSKKRRDYKAKKAEEGDNVLKKLIPSYFAFSNEAFIPFLTLFGLWGFRGFLKRQVAYLTGNSERLVLNRENIEISWL